MTTPGHALPSIVVCAALLDVIYDIRIVPLGMYMRPRLIKCIAECFVAIFIVEVGMLVFWQSLEHVVFMLAKSLLLGMKLVSPEYYYDHEATLIGAFTLPISLIILASVVIYSNHMAKLRARYMAREMQVHLQLDNTVNFLSRSNRFKDSKCRKILDSYNSNAKRSRNPKWMVYFPDE